MDSPPDVVYLDTHIAVWCADAETRRLSRKAKAAIDGARCIRVSPFVLLELEYLYEIDVLQISGKELVSYLGAAIELQICNLPMPLVMDEAARLKWTRDPFDRVIVAQARAAGDAPLITADRRIRKNYSNAVWD